MQTSNTYGRRVTEDDVVERAAARARLTRRKLTRGQELAKAGLIFIVAMVGVALVGAAIVAYVVGGVGR